MDEPRFSHTLHSKDENAYIIGGYTNKLFVKKSCLYFNALNHKMENFAELIVPRCRAGTMVTSLYIYVFGGYGNNHWEIDQIERCFLTSGQTEFCCVDVED